MKKKLLLCKPCAVTMGACIDLVQVTREKDKKVVCEQCGRKRFGAEYEVGRKGGGSMSRDLFDDVHDTMLGFLALALFFAAAALEGAWV